MLRRILLHLKYLLEVHTKIITNDLIIENNEDEYSIHKARSTCLAIEISREVIFRPPEHDEVPELIESFLEWLKFS